MSSTAPRRYGRPPYDVVVVHGGPGAAGTLAPLARVLGTRRGVLEPWQNATSVAGQVRELARQIGRWGSPPVVLIGHSWGAWLSLLVAGRHPELVHRLVLVGSGPLRAGAAREIARRRRIRLSESDWVEFVALSRLLAGHGGGDRAAAMRRLGELSELADSYDRLPHARVRVRLDPAALRAVGAEAAEMRRSGELERTVRRVRAPVLVIHGANDPHPIEGVVEPLRHAGLDVRAVRLARCGHEPWWERHARRKFFAVLTRELRAKRRRPEPTRIMAARKSRPGSPRR